MCLFFSWWFKWLFNYQCCSNQLIISALLVLLFHINHILNIQSNESNIIDFNNMQFTYQCPLSCKGSVCIADGRWLKTYEVITFDLFMYLFNRDRDQSPRWGRLYTPDVGSCTWTNCCCWVSAPKCMKKKITWCIIHTSWFYFTRACPLCLLTGCNSIQFFAVGCWPQPPGQREGKCIVLGLQ